MGLLGDTRPFLEEFHRKHAIVFYAAVLLGVVVLVEGILALAAFLLPPEFCIEGMIGNCAGLRILESQGFWANATPLALSMVRLGEGNASAVVRNIGAEPAKLVGVSLIGVEDKRVEYSYSGAAVLQPQGEIEVRLVSERGCGGGIARFDVKIEYVSSAGQGEETGRRLFVKCGG
jgi:hypothetical protein